MLPHMTQVLEKQSKVLDRLIMRMEALEKPDEVLEKTAATSETAQRLHGIGGIFSTLGLDRDIVTAHVRPYGLSSFLPKIATLTEDPRFGAITGVTDDVGSEPANVCDDAPTGYLKSCNLTAKFGLLRRDTNTIDINRSMMKINRGDFTDLMLHGRMLGLESLSPSGMPESDILNLMVASEMVNTGVRAERVLNRRLWQGTVAVDGTPGLDVQIATGQVDADTGVTCPALDSDVKDFAYHDVCDTTWNIVNYLSMVVRYVQYNAMVMGLEPVTWLIAMRPDLFWELSECWPCQYNTSRCANAVIGSASSVFIDGRENIADRDSIRASMQLPINGQVFQVVPDTGIFEHNSTNNAQLVPGQYASSIYVIPLTITGGMPVTYIEHIDYRAAQANIAFLKGLQEFWTDDGIFSWALEMQKWCIKLALRTEQRVVLRTPHLAGRIDHVRYSPLQHLRDADPDSPYWKDGGVSVRGHTSGQAVWS